MPLDDPHGPIFQIDDQDGHPPRYSWTSDTQTVTNDQGNPPISRGKSPAATFAHYLTLRPAPSHPSNYEQKYAADAPYEELGPSARVWKVYEDEAEKFDADMARGWRESLDMLMIFASPNVNIVEVFHLRFK